MSVQVLVLKNLRAQALRRWAADDVEVRFAGVPLLVGSFLLEGVHILLQVGQDCHDLLQHFLLWWWLL